jgi:hypothetical protein
VKLGKDFIVSVVPLKEIKRLTIFAAAPSDAPIEYQTIQFHNNLAGDITPFQGPSTPESDAAWEQLLDGKEYKSQGIVHFTDYI